MTERSALLRALLYALVAAGLVASFYAVFAGLSALGPWLDSTMADWSSEEWQTVLLVAILWELCRKPNR